MQMKNIFCLALFLLIGSCTQKNTMNLKFYGEFIVQDSLKLGDDFIGGNYYAIMNFSSTLPQILPNSQNLDIGTFLDIANIWGVDDDVLEDGSELRSSIGVGVDWFTPVGPLSFSFAHPITKNSSDKTETFRFNLGTTF